MACFTIYWLGNDVENPPERHEYSGIKEAETNLKKYLLKEDLLDSYNYRHYLKYFHSNSEIPISEDEKKIDPDNTTDFDEISDTQFNLDLNNPDIPLEHLCIKYGGSRFYSNGRTQRNKTFAFWDYDISVTEKPIEKPTKKLKIKIGKKL